MSIFSINISSLVHQCTAPILRTVKNNVLFNALLSAFGRRSSTFYEYKIGTSAGTWGAGPYAKYEQVVYNQAVYESLIEDNYDTPDVASSWYKIIDSWIGVDESQLYNGGKMVLEYALNRYFGTTGIYIGNNIAPQSAFRVGIEENVSSSVGYDTSSESVPLGYSTSTSLPSFTIYVPNLFYVSLGPNVNQIISNFADNYVATSLTYNITDY